MDLKDVYREAWSDSIIAKSDDIDFVELVSQMRKAQKQYFTTPRGDAKQDWLKLSLRLEKMVDIKLQKLRS